MLDTSPEGRSIEIYFSIIQRKVLTPNDFVDLEEVGQRLLAFGRRYEAAAKPFEWKFTRQDLRDLMDCRPRIFSLPPERRASHEYVSELMGLTTKVTSAQLTPRS